MNALTRWNQFKELEDLQHTLGSLFGRSQARWPDGQEETIKASTGPRPRGRGWCSSNPRTPGIKRASTGPRPRGRGWWSRVSLVSGNESASTGPRPRGRGWGMGSPLRSVFPVLQRGRARAGADGVPELQAIRSYPAGFNGAAPARARMADHAMAPPDGVLASTGPRPRGRGWNGPGRSRPRSRCASTGPRPRGRGWAALGRPPFAQRLASTGPRPRGRGWRQRQIGEENVATASTGPRPRGRGWAGFPGNYDQLGVASTGPRPRGRGWRPRGGRGRRHVLSASTGPRPRGRGWLQVVLVPPRLVRLQRGRARAGADGPFARLPDR